MRPSERYFYINSIAIEFVLEYGEKNVEKAAMFQSKDLIYF